MSLTLMGVEHVTKARADHSQPGDDRYGARDLGEWSGPLRGIRSLALLRFGLIVAATAVVALLCARPAEAQGEPVLTFEGRVTSVSPREMLVAAERDGVVVDVVMIDLARIPQSETRQIAQDDIVVVIGFIRRPGHKVIATSVQPVSRWFPTTPAWAPQVR
jgi:hypothetical protein